MLGKQLEIQGTGLRLQFAPTVADEEHPDSGRLRRRKLLADVLGRPDPDDPRQPELHVDLGHDAATPVGMRATAAIELVAMEGRRLRFKVECRDERDAIGAGYHERFVIDEARFLSKLDQKRAR